MIKKVVCVVFESVVYTPLNLLLILIYIVDIKILLNCSFDVIW